MSKLTKKQQKINELLEGFEQPATAKDALTKLQEISSAVSKFDETVECHMRLGIDVKQADQQVRSTTVLPAGLGKEVRVCVIAPSPWRLSSGRPPGHTASGRWLSGRARRTIWSTRPLPSSRRRG